jgi:hypothetical protein
MIIPPKLAEILSKHLPDEAVNYCLSVWQQKPFHFKITASRKSKLGDFRYRRDQDIQTITINGDLNPYQFLLTYIHEVAHLHAFVKFGMKINPHGIEWKTTFQELMAPLFNLQAFPIDLVVPLRNHLKNPKASSSSDLFLVKEMSKYDQRLENQQDTFLSDLIPGKRFLLSGREFEKGETRRTRVVCLEIKTGRKFLVAQLAKVIPL